MYGPTNDLRSSAAAIEAPDVSASFRAKSLRRFLAVVLVAFGLMAAARSQAAETVSCPQNANALYASGGGSPAGGGASSGHVAGRFTGSARASFHVGITIVAPPSPAAMDCAARATACTVSKAPTGSPTAVDVSCASEYTDYNVTTVFAGGQARTTAMTDTAQSMQDLSSALSAGSGDVVAITY